MTEAGLACVEIEPAVPVRAAVIWLHGLGADGHDFEPVVPLLGLDPSLGVRFVFPHAPRIPVTVNMGFVMPAWYDILGLEPGAQQDEAGIRRSACRVEALLAREKARGVPAGSIVMAGFSQGGAVAVHTALRHPERLAGLVALSTYLVLPSALEKERSRANAGLPVFQAHGLRDPMVPLERGEDARRRLEAMGHPVDWHSYPIQHEVCPEEIRALGAWLSARLATRERASDDSRAP